MDTLHHTFVRNNNSIYKSCKSRLVRDQGEVLIIHHKISTNKFGSSEEQEQE